MMRKLYEAALLFVGTLGWWGFVYPGLCPDGEVYREEVSQEESVHEAGEREALGQRVDEALGESENPPQALRKTEPQSGQEALPDCVPSPGGFAQKEQTAFREMENVSAPVWELGEIRIKSRLMEYVCEMKENRQRKRE